MPFNNFQEVTNSDKISLTDRTASGPAPDGSSPGSSDWGNISNTPTSAEGYGIVNGDELDAFGAMSGLGLVTKTADATYAARTLTAGDNVSITNPAGIAGNPVIAVPSIPWADITGTPTTLAGYGITDAQPLDGDLTAIAALSTTGYARRTGVNTWALDSFVPASLGGTGFTTYADGDLLYGLSGALGILPHPGTLNNVLVTDFFGGLAWAAYSAVGVTEIIGTANQVLANGTSGTGQKGIVTLTLPQDIHTGASPQFAREGLGGPISDFDSGVVIGVTANSGTIPAPLAGTLFQIAGANSMTTRFALDTWAAPSVIQMRRASGTRASPSAVQSGDIIGVLGASGYLTSAYNTASSGQIRFVASENWSTSAAGTDFRVILAPNGSLGITTEFDFLNNGDFRVPRYQYFGTNSNQILNFATGNFQFLSGATHDGTNFTARTATPSRIRLSSVINFSIDSGLTIGNTFTPTDVAVLSTTGLALTGSITTAAPSGGSAQPWKLGEYSSGLVRVEVAGSPYLLAASAQDLRTTATPQFARLGLGLSADATVLFTASANSVTPLASSTGTMMHLVGANSANPRFDIDGFAGIPIFQARRANGTLASPSAVLSGETLVSFAGFGYGSTAFSSGSGGQFVFRTTENWTDTARGTEMGIILCPTGSAAQTTTFRFTNDGAFQTMAPSGSTARPWKLGDVSAVTPTAPNRTVAIDVNGTVLYLHAKTTND